MYNCFGAESKLKSKLISLTERNTIVVVMYKFLITFKNQVFRREKNYFLCRPEMLYNKVFDEFGIMIVVISVISFSL